jgi:hypothetical protein
MQVCKIEGQLADIRIGAHEPDDLNYNFYSAFRSNAKQRGTMFGCPGFGEYYNTFNGAIRYDTLTLFAPHGEKLLLKDVIAIKKFQPFIYLSNRCTFYLLSGRNSGESKLIFALKTKNHQLDDLAGIGSMGEILMSSIRRQLKLVAIPTVLSIVLFCAIMLPIVASVLGGAVYVGFGIICSFIIPLFVLGLAALKKKIKVFPTKAVLKNILQHEGFTLREDWEYNFLD